VKKPKIGDIAMIDGKGYTVFAVEPNGKPVVVFADENRKNLAERVKAVRANPELRVPVFEPPLSQRQKFDIRKATQRLSDELGGIPRGVTLSVNIRHLVYHEALGVWSLPKRLEAK
jgi:hypothetical protein